jgi:hypothetical protein
MEEIKANKQEVRKTKIEERKKDIGITVTADVAAMCYLQNRLCV